MTQEGGNHSSRQSLLKRKRCITDDNDEEVDNFEENVECCRVLQESTSIEINQNESQKYGRVLRELSTKELNDSRRHSKPYQEPDSEGTENNEDLCTRVLNELDQEIFSSELDEEQPLTNSEEADSDDVVDNTTDLSNAHSSTWSQFRRNSCMLTPIIERASPLPHLTWANANYLWEVMCHKDYLLLSQRDEGLFSRHPTLQSRMRSILLDWIIEVCEVYRLHRETYHLTMDFIDRYLSSENDIPKNQLQLIGITSLFIAAKLEEIYPPKINEFAYVTDGACTETEITNMEIVLLKALNWRLSVFTANSWLNTYMQLYCSNQSKIRRYERSSRPDNTFHLPQYSGMAFSETAQLLDLCMLDVGCLRYSYSVLAASALYHVFNRELALFVSGYQWEHLKECADWMSAFAITVREDGGLHQGGSNTSPSMISSRGSHNIVLDESHKIQKHFVDLVMLEKAQKRLSSLSSPESSPIKELPVTSSGVLTPPSSHKKQSQAQEITEGV